MKVPTSKLLFLSTVILTCISDSKAQEIRASRSCFESDQDIVISFRNGDDPISTDWVGIYPIRDVNPDEEPILWHWTCGSQQCDEPTNQGIVMFSPSGNMEGWPPPLGTYRAVLARDAPAEYVFLAISDEFRIVGIVQECDGDSIVDLTQIPVIQAPMTSPPVTAGPVTLSPESGGVLPPTTAAPTTVPPVSTTRMGQIIASAKNDIIALIRERPVLRALYLRMIFHDCVGGACDGCINTNNMDNGGLGSSMGSLQEVARRYQPDLSRADIWVLASFVGVEQAMPGIGEGDHVELPFHFYGREDCRDRLDRGPDPPLCSPNLGTDDVLEFFAREFAFNAQETAAIMGGHTIGIARRNILGFNGPFGWVPNNTLFDNEYYRELVGEGPTSQFHFEHAPQWRQVEVNNTDLNRTDITNRWQWEGFPGGRRVIMLNADIALVRQLDDANKEESGFVSCRFVSRAPGDTLCPASRDSIFGQMVRYRHDNMAFIEDFRDAMVKMTNVGYAVDMDTCDAEGNCRLIRQSSSNTTATGGP